jgi:hypothetical protein
MPTGQMKWPLFKRFAKTHGGPIEMQQPQAIAVIVHEDEHRPPAGLP